MQLFNQSLFQVCQIIVIIIVMHSHEAIVAIPGLGCSIIECEKNVIGPFSQSSHPYYNIIMFSCMEVYLKNAIIISLPHSFLTLSL
jgi:hypothetical protein